MRIIPFNVEFVDNPTLPNQKKIDRDLEAYIENNELEGVLNLLIQYAQRWIDNNYSLEPNGQPQAVIDATDEAINNNDPLKLFIKDCLIKDTEHTELKVSTIYETYVHWASEQGIEHPMSQIALSRELRGYLPFTKKVDRYVLNGYIMNSDWDIHQNTRQFICNN